MIEMRRAQRSFGDGLIAEEVSDLREGWMKHADTVLADEAIVAAVYEALAKRHPKSRCRGRRGMPADMVLRLLVLKHIRNWSYEVLEREVRANLVYRDFTHVGGAKTPDAKTMGRWGVALGPEVLKQVHECVVRIDQALLGRTPHLVAADAAFYSAKNETAAKAKGVKRVCIPNRSTKSLERKREQRKRWFRNGQKWRTGSEGRISVVKRRHGLDRCRYKGYLGMNRWVGLGVIADNVVNIGRAMEKQAAP